MATLNSAGAAHARSLVASGEVDKTDDWSFSAEDGNALLGANGDDWTNYARWFLGVDASQPEKTKARYKYPFGKGGKAYRSGLIAVKQRAAQQGDDSIEGEASSLVEKIDGPAGKSAAAKVRAFARLETKALEETSDAYVIRGVASTPRTDRVGDIVEPMGARFGALPKLFLHHDTTLPIGNVSQAKPTTKGIPFEARIPKVLEPGIVQDRINEAVHSIKYDLLSYVSIGFQPDPKETEVTKTGYRFKEWDWLELSVVGVPANPDAVITGIKSIDDELRAACVTQNDARATSGRNAAVVHLKSAGVPAPSTQRKAMATYQEQVASFEAKRAASVAAVDALLAKAAGEGRTFTEEEKQEHDSLEAEVKAIDEHLPILKKAADRVKETAAPVPPTPRAGMEIKPKHGEFVVRANPNMPKGIGFARVAMCLASTKGNCYSAAEVAKRQTAWKDSTPQVEAVLSNWDFITRSSVNVGNSTDTSYASPLVQYTNMASEFVEYLRPMTIIGKMPNLRRVPFNIRFATQTGAVSVGWVGQGNAAPATSQTYTTTTLGFAKISAIVGITDELARFSDPAAEQLVRDDLALSTVSYMDQQFIDPGVAAVASTSPASVTNGATATQASGTWSTANLASVVDIDMAALFNNLTSNNVPLDNLVWVMTPGSAYKISKIRTANGPTAFPDINIGGGTLEGIPVIVSQQVPSSTSAGSILVLLRQSDIFMADGNGVEIDTSQEASVQMQTAPSNSAASLLSAFQSDLLLLRLRRIINWQRRRDVSVTYLDNVHFA